MNKEVKEKGILEVRKILSGESLKLVGVLDEKETK